MSGFKVHNARDAEFEADRILNFLAALPSGITSAERPVVREIMLRTSGEMLAQGEIFDIVAKNLGAGVYQLRLARREPVTEGDRAEALRQVVATRSGGQHVAPTNDDPPSAQLIDLEAALKRSCR